MCLNRKSSKVAKRERKKRKAWNWVEKGWKIPPLPTSFSRLFRKWGNRGECELDSNPPPPLLGGALKCLANLRGKRRVCSEQEGLGLRVARVCVDGNGFFCHMQRLLKRSPYSLFPRSFMPVKSCGAHFKKITYPHSRTMGMGGGQKKFCRISRFHQLDWWRLCGLGGDEFPSNILSPFFPVYTFFSCSSKRIYEKWTCGYKFRSRRKRRGRKGKKRGGSPLSPFPLLETSIRLRGRLRRLPPFVRTYGFYQISFCEILVTVSKWHCLINTFSFWN